MFMFFFTVCVCNASMTVLYCFSATIKKTPTKNLAFAEDLSIPQLCYPESLYKLHSLSSDSFMHVHLV